MPFFDSCSCWIRVHSDPWWQLPLCWMSAAVSARLKCNKERPPTQQKLLEEDLIHLFPCVPCILLLHPCPGGQGREPWQRGMGFLPWKTKLQTLLSYRSEATQPSIQGGSSPSPGHHLPRDMSVREVCDTGDRLCDVWPNPHTSWLLQQG